MNVASTCLLCTVSDESRDHIFFDCSYSQEVWTRFFVAPAFSPPQSFESIIAWLPSAAGNTKVRDICHLLFQAILYVLWKERNGRLHTSTTKPSRVLIKEISVIIKAKLFGSCERGLSAPTITALFNISRLLSSTMVSPLQLLAEVSIKEIVVTAALLHMCFL